LREIIRTYPKASDRDIDILVVLKKPVIDLSFKVLCSLISDRIREIENNFNK
jgi:RNase P protein component